MIKKLFFTVFMSLLSLISWAQGLTSNTNLYVQSGAVLYVKSNFSNNSTVENDGELRVSGNFVNNGTSDIGSMVVLDGSGAQSVDGNSDFTGVLAVSKSSGVATVNSGQSRVHGILRLMQGQIAANDRLVISSTPTGTGLVDDFSSISYVGSVSGRLRVQRYIDGVSGIRYIGTPVNTPGLAAELSELNPSGPDGGQVLPTPDCNPDELYWGSPYGNIMEWRENGPFPGPQNWAPTCDLWGWHVRSSGFMTNGRGYSAWINSGNTIEIGGVANTSLGSVVSYDGLARTTAVGDGWHLVSNPFPSPIDWSLDNYNDINSASSGTFAGGLARWVSSGTYHGTYQSMTPTFDPSGGNGLIGSMQGFFVQALPGPAVNWYLPQSVRSLGDPTFYKQETLNRIDIIVSGAGFADRTTIKFGDDLGATNDYDFLVDAHKLESANSQPNIYSRIRSDKYSINSLSLENYPMTIPLDLVAGVDGSFTIDAKFLETFTVEPHVYLEDLFTGTMQELTVNPTYVFDAKASDDSERFLLHFRLNGDEPIYLSEDENDVMMYVFDGTANVYLPESNRKNSFSVYNSLGALVYESSSVLGEGKNSFDLSHLPHGVYVLQVKLKNKSFSKKAVL